MVFKEKNSRLSLVFERVLKEFLSQKDFILFVFGFFENQRKLGFWEIVFVFHFLPFTSDFPSSFFFVAGFQKHLVSTLELSSILIY